jgi:hypothetical protein
MGYGYDYACTQIAEISLVTLICKITHPHGYLMEFSMHIDVITWILRPGLLHTNDTWIPQGLLQAHGYNHMDTWSRTSPPK